MKEYGVSLLKPNKRFSISKTDRKDRIIELLKNVWRVRYWFRSKFGREITIINGDQMPLHRNENASQKTLSFTGETTYVKENYMLSRERITVFTQVSSDTSNPLPLPEFVFKGKGTRTKLNRPPGIKSHWAPKGSYRLNTMLDTIANLPNRFNMFSQSNYALYILDDYSVHITDEVKEALLAKGYILVVIGGGITVDIQCNDTHIHHPLKKKYRELEAQEMIEMLQKDPGKIPSPSRDEIMSMLTDAWNSLDIDVDEALKQNFITSAFDGSDDYKVSEKFYSLVFTEMNDLRQKLQSSPPPNSLKDLIATITPPKGGIELFDCEGEVIEVEKETEKEEIEEFETDDEDIDMAIETTETNDDGVSINKVLESLIDKVVEIEHHNPFLRCTELDWDLKKDVLFLDRVMEVIQTSETSALFTPYVLKLKQVCSAGRISLRKRIKTNHKLKDIVKCGNKNEIVNDQNNSEEGQHQPEDIDDDDDDDDDDDGNIFDVLSLYRDK